MDELTQWVKIIAVAASLIFLSLIALIGVLGGRAK